uniref:Uncharacterized protein n=1 Tax=Trichuris muris TaxID=70415 RepID=A0A5S6R0A1_TRIMR
MVSKVEELFRRNRRVEMKKDVSDKMHSEVEKDYLGDAFLLFDAFLCAGMAVALIFAPKQIMDAVLTEESDGVHWHMARCLGSIFMGQAAVCFIWLLLSTDVTCRSSVIMNRLQASLLGLFACFKVSPGEAGIPSMTAKGFVWIAGLLFCHSLIFVCLLGRRKFQIGDALVSPEARSLNALNQVDSLVATVVGAVWFAMPEWILYGQVKIVLSGSHIFVSRLFGAYLMATSVHSSRAMYFKTKADHRIWIFGRSLICAGILLAQLYSQFAYLQWWTANHWFGIALFSVWSTVAFGVFRTEMLENAHSQ